MVVGVGADDLQMKMNATTATFFNKLKYYTRPMLKTC